MRNKYLFGNMRGEIATILTIISAVMMIAGMITGTVINQQGTRTTSRAAGCASGEWECTVDGATHCADQNTRDIFSGTWCNPDLRWKWEDAGNSDKCGGSPAKLKPADGNCADVTPTSVPSGNCPSGQWTCKVGTYTRCSDDTAKSEFTANWCNPEQRWQYETAKLLGGNGSECNGKVSQTLPNCSTATPTSNPSSNCPSGQWNCTFDGKTYCSDDAAKTLFLDTWCDGKNRWLWESAGNSDKCQGNADIPINSPDCKRNPITTTSPTPVLSPSPIPTPEPNPTKASNPGGFHLTSEIYAEKATDGIKFNVHILFNSDGCDGDIKLNRDGSLVAGPNSWNIKMGRFDYNQEWAGSFEVKKGESVSPGYEGMVDRCPKSTTTLRDNISCTMAVDSSGAPGVSGAGCTFKNQSEFPTYNPASPTLGAPSGPDGKYKCQDLTNSKNKDCNDTMAGPCEYGTYKYKCTTSACGTDKSVGIGIPFWCDGDKWYNVNKAGECSNACTPAGNSTPTPSSECQGKADGFVISNCTQQECETVNKKWINVAKICQGGIAYTKPDKLTSEACNPQTDKTKTCTPGTGTGTPTVIPTVRPGFPTYTPIPTRAGSTTPFPTIGATKKINVKYDYKNDFPGWTDDKATLYLESKVRPVETYTLYKENVSQTYSSIVDMEIGREYTAKIKILYSLIAGPSDCTHQETSVGGNPITKTITPTDTEWKIYGGANQTVDCNPASKPTDIPGTANSTAVALRYHLGNVCVGINCNLPEEWATVYLKVAGSPVQSISLPKEAYAGPGLGFQVFSKMVNMVMEKEYTAKVMVKYKVSNQQCMHEDTVKNTLHFDKLSWDIDGGLNAAIDCVDVDKRMNATLTGSSNQDFIAVIDRYARGEIGAKEVSTFISQLNRSPFQPVYCTCPGGNCSQCTGPVYPAQGEESL